jgi:hypothetical protein
MGEKVISVKMVLSKCENILKRGWMNATAGDFDILATGWDILKTEIVKLKSKGETENE